MLNIPDVPYTNFQVRRPDPHRFDRDKDGISCEA
ncbi:MAG: excalibur calcium-binding domain-containing protein [Drouetiella hepatica Uher 2000/2452]|uniref:Excalibur calcium-binding domain-containing protein n=1 Tax=Drouetiella hepatica Uher 2000/2452 TaxID=904376 RepID=A0A951QGG1_9CYAN|nr:excalibur calcium-binding domain-containing protein [Drouetiella hepatica Uher 2000/2452]